MSNIDDRIAQGLERLIDTPEASGMIEHVRVRKARRSIVRKVSIVAISLAVVGASVGSGALLVRAFGSSPRPASSSTIPSDIVPVVPHRNGAIAFFAGTGRAFFGSQRLYVSDPGWHQIRPLSHAAGYDALAWSPDGRHIAFVQTFGEFGGGRALVSSYAADQGQAAGRTKILVETESFLGGLTWSPGGLWIAYTKSVGELGHGSVQYSLFAVPAAGGKSIRLTSSPLDAHDPAWSPRGDSIAFSGEFIGKGNPGSDIYLLGPSGTVRDLTSTVGTPETEPVWSPDGRWIAFASGTREGRTLEVMRPDGTDRRVVFKCGCSGFFSGPTWSPDGRFIAVATGPASVTLLSPSGHRARTVEVPVEGIGAQSACCFAWQPVRVPSGS